jgi:hypothetical protein
LPTRRTARRLLLLLSLLATVLFLLSRYISINLITLVSLYTLRRVLLSIVTAKTTTSSVRRTLQLLALLPLRFYLL